MDTDEKLRNWETFNIQHSTPNSEGKRKNEKAMHGAVQFNHGHSAAQSNPRGLRKRTKAGELTRIARIDTDFCRGSLRLFDCGSLARRCHEVECADYVPGEDDKMRMFDRMGIKWKNENRKQKNENRWAGHRKAMAGCVANVLRLAFSTAAVRLPGSNTRASRPRSGAFGRDGVRKRVGF